MLNGDRKGFPLRACEAEEKRLSLPPLAEEAATESGRDDQDTLFQGYAVSVLGTKSCRNVNSNLSSAMSEDTG